MNGLPILIVEDDTFLREIYIDTLTKAGYQIETAVDGEEALQKIPSKKWALILLDILMPKMTGIQVVKQLKNDPDTSQLLLTSKIVFLTNLDNDSEIQEALQFGDGYLIKSQLTPGDLLNEVKHYLST